MMRKLKYESESLYTIKRQKKCFRELSFYGNGFFLHMDLVYIFHEQNSSYCFLYEYFF